MKTGRAKGFTIVELLIVIVVIAILAAITIVAYNGVQVRARNSARLQAADTIYKQLELYTVQTSSFYGSPIACIPTEANYDAGNGGLPDCYASDAPRSEVAAVNSNLAAAGFTKFSYPNTPITDTSGVVYRGIHIAYFSNMNQGMNGVLRPFILIFFLEGQNQDCGPNSVTQDGSKVSTDPLNSIIPARNYTSDANMTWCFLSLTYYTQV